MGMDLELADRIVLITGPAKGMGSASAAAFARGGCGARAEHGGLLRHCARRADGLFRLQMGRCGLTKSMALEAGPYGINVNLLAPGMVDGERFRTKIVPTMARQFGITQAEDVANAGLFLAAPVSRQITGIDLPVDGGWAMM
jgi:NAD(P)-dependent dehydrogenase (short-subunit alcohol dehydrogenase family)